MRVPPARTKRRSLEVAAIGLFATALTGLAAYAVTGRDTADPAIRVGPERTSPAQEERIPQALPKRAPTQDPQRTGAPAAPTGTGHEDPEIPPMLDKRAAGREKKKKVDQAAPTEHGKRCFKGVATWAYPNSKASLKDSRACWFYSWGPDRAGITAPKSAEFVPMVHRAATIDDVARLKGRGHRYLLGFNEPDLAAQANMSVEQALDLWPRLMSTGLILGSPAVATGAELPGGWLDRFMKGAEKRRLRVDFIALHWYGADFRAKPATKQLRTYLRKVHKRYKKPIWLTEFALTDFTQATPRYPSQKQQAAFLREAAEMLRNEPYLKRYAWFALPTNRSGTGLYDPDGSATPTGRAFRSAPGNK